MHTDITYISGAHVDGSYIKTREVGDIMKELTDYINRNNISSYLVVTRYLRQTAI